MSHYTSDITQFLNQLKQAHPHIEQDQQYGRSLLWDQQPRSSDDQRRDQLARVAKQPYEYYTVKRS
jgi:hypothetical protein